MSNKLYKPEWRPYMKRYKRWNEMNRKEKRQFIRDVLAADQAPESKFKAELKEDKDERKI